MDGSQKVLLVNPFSAGFDDDEGPGREIFRAPKAKPFHQNCVRLRFFRLLQASAFGRCASHDLRHTFASLLLQRSPVYVKDQMGHCSVQITVDLYGNKQALDRLDFVAEERVLDARICNPCATNPGVPGSHVIGSAAISDNTREGAGVDDGFRIQPSHPILAI